MVKQKDLFGGTCPPHISTRRRSGHIILSRVPPLGYDRIPPCEMEIDCIEDCYKYNYDQLMERKKVLLINIEFHRQMIFDKRCELDMINHFISQ